METLTFLKLLLQSEGQGFGLFIFLSYSQPSMSCLLKLFHSEEIREKVLSEATGQTNLQGRSLQRG